MNKLQKLLRNIKISNTKRDFDLQHPEIIDTGVRRPNGETIKYTKFFCKNCGVSLSLDEYQMKELPRKMAYGCTKQK